MGKAPLFFRLDGKSQTPAHILELRVAHRLPERELVDVFGYRRDLFVHGIEDKAILVRVRLAIGGSGAVYHLEDNSAAVAMRPANLAGIAAEFARRYPRQ